VSRHPTANVAVEKQLSVHATGIEKTISTRILLTVAFGLFGTAFGW
jgi:hypothetical protein